MKEQTRSHTVMILEGCALDNLQEESISSQVRGKERWSGYLVWDHKLTKREKKRGKDGEWCNVGALCTKSRFGVRSSERHEETGGKIKEGEENQRKQRKGV